MRHNKRRERLRDRTEYYTTGISSKVYNKLNMYTRHYAATVTRVGMIVSDNWQDFSPKYRSGTVDPGPL